MCLQSVSEWPRSLLVSAFVRDSLVESLWREEQIVLGVFLSLEAGASLAFCPGISRDVPAAFPKQEHASHRPESRLNPAARNSPKNKTTLAGGSNCGCLDRAEDLSVLGTLAAARFLHAAQQQSARCCSPRQPSVVPHWHCDFSGGCDLQRTGTRNFGGGSSPARFSASASEFHS